MIGERHHRAEHTGHEAGEQPDHTSSVRRKPGPACGRRERAGRLAAALSRVDGQLSLDGYVVEELLGFGGAGEVWRAREVATQEAVALKRLRTRGPAATERLRREAGLLATVAGPHVVGVRRLLVEDDEAVLVMDLAAGGSLADLLAARRRLPAPEIVTVLAPIAAALAAAHSHDLVHGDITPANILFTADGRPQLADFGVARAVAPQPDHVEATVEYVDPAVANGASPTPASDVFALGAVGFAAVAGESVWGGGTPEQRLDRARRGDRPMVPAIAPAGTPPALATALESMLAADPDERPDARSAAMAILRASAAAPVGLVGRIARDPPPVTHRIAPPVPDNPPDPLARRRPRLRASPDAGTRPTRLGAYDTMPGQRPEPAEGDDFWSEDGEPRSWPAWGRRAVIGGACALALLGVAGVGISLGRSNHRGASATTQAVATTSAASTADPSPPPDPQTATRANAPDPAGTGWPAVVAHLDSLRAQAFADAAPADLAAVYAPGAAAYATDLTTVRSLVSRGLRAHGFSATVDRVTPDSGDATSEVLTVVDRLSSYTLVDAAGNVVGRGKARPPRAFTMRLTRVGGSWRVAQISPG